MEESAYKFTPLMGTLNHKKFRKNGNVDLKLSSKNIKHVKPKNTIYASL